MGHITCLAVSLAFALGLAACGQGGATPAASSASTSTKPSAASPAASSPAASAKPAISASAKPAASGAAKPAASGSAAASAVGANTQFSGGDPNGYPIRISYASVAVSGLAFYTALDKGLFQQQHLKVTMIQMPPSVAVPALAQGDTEFADSPGTTIEGATRGLPMKVLFATWRSAPWTVMGKPEFNSLKDLKGKTIITGQPGTSTQAYLFAGIKRAGLTPSDFKIVNSPGTSQTYGQLLNGTGEAGEVSPPFDAMAEEKGFHQVEFLGDALQIPYIGLGGNTKFVADHRAQVVATLRALIDANAYLRAHPADAADLIVKYIGSTPSVAKKSADKMLPLLNDANFEASAQGIQQSLDEQAAATKTTVPYKPEQLVDYGPLKEAQAKS